MIGRVRRKWENVIVMSSQIVEGVEVRERDGCWKMLGKLPNPVST
jgi:hypothetical protein